jgi:hypothetical protein
MRPIRLLVFGVLGGLLAAAAGAQLPRPRGGQTIANLTLALDQDEAVVAVDAAGNFVVAWRADGQDGDGSAIVARRFSGRTGLPLSGEILVNVNPAGEQTNPALAVAQDGRFVVAWEGPDFQGSLGVFGSFREADGTPIVAEFPVNTTLAGNQERPAVTFRANGDFLVLWQSEVTVPDGFAVSKEILGRIFLVTGGPMNEFQVNRITLGDQEQPAAAADPVTGGWFTVWQGPELSSAIPSILYLRLLPDGPPPPGVQELILNLLTPGIRRHSAVAANAVGEAVAVWEGPDGSGAGIFRREITAGLPIGVEELVNLTTAGEQREPSVALDDQGAFVTVWIHEPVLESQEGSPIVVQGRKKTSSAPGEVPAPDGEFQVSTSGDRPAEPWVDIEPRGNFVVAWQAEGVDDPQDPLGRAALFQRFSDAIFADDFETADTSRWSLASP